MPHWGMVIDLDKCTGCEACVIVCRTEKNVPIAGEQQTALGRQINADGEKRALRDGEVKPACVQSCPTTAMYFGDLDDHESEVSRKAESGRAFHLLGELGTKPRVIYLKQADER